MAVAALWLSSRALGIAYTAIYALLQGTINRLGAEFPVLHAELLKKTQEALLSFREIQVAGKERYFVGRFAQPSKTAASNSVRYRLLELLPVLLLETIAFATLLTIAIIIALRSEGVSEFIGVIALYGLAAYRLVPAIKEVFSGAADIKYNLAAFDLLEDDLRLGRKGNTGWKDSAQPSPVIQPATTPENAAESSTPPAGFQTIEFDKVSFRYGNDAREALRLVSITLSRGARICVAGPSGSGKSTFVDLLLGLLSPSEGRLLIDGKTFTNESMQLWRSMIGYVPQSTLLLEDSVARNIAFGCADEKIDMQRVQEAARQAQIHEFICNELPQGYQTIIAREGLKLSGGQQQRIGIARALYHNPSMLILDEASSALDLQTETRLLECLLALPDKTLLFVSHKANVAAHCDQVMVIQDGEVKALTTYQNLVLMDSPYRSLLENELK